MISLAERMPGYQARLYRYALMPNYGHLLIETRLPNVSVFPGNLLTSYALLRSIWRMQAVRYGMLLVITWLTVTVGFNAPAAWFGEHGFRESVVKVYATIQREDHARSWQPAAPPGVHL